MNRTSKPALEETRGGEGVPDAFVELPHEIYADDPYWIPEDREATKRAFSAENAFFEEGIAHTWTVPGKARLAVYDHERKQIDGVPLVFFGHWETTGDEAVDRDLFDRAAEWAQANGAKALFGPIDFTTFGRFRVATGSDDPAAGPIRPFVDEPYNPLRYADRLKELGFRMVGPRFFTKALRRPLLERWVERGREPRAKLEAEGFTITVEDKDGWHASLPELYDFVNAVFGGQFGYTKPTFDEFKQMRSRPHVDRADTDRSFIVRDPEGKIAALTIQFPDYGPLVVSGAGDRRVEVKDLDSRIHIPVLKELGNPWWILKTMGVHPDYRGTGMIRMMFGEAAEVYLEDTTEWEGCLAALATCGTAIDHIVGAVPDPKDRYYELYGREL